MNKLFTKIGTAMVGIAMAIGVGVAVGRDGAKEVKAATTTYTFTSKSWADETSSWSSTKDGTQTGDARGVAIQKAATGAGAITKTSISNITKVTINCSKSSNGVGSISVSVGSTEVINVSSFNTSDTAYDSSALSNVSGKVSFTVTCTNSTLYVKSITIVTGSSKTFSSMSVVDENEQAIANDSTINVAGDGTQSSVQASFTATVSYVGADSDHNVSVTCTPETETSDNGSGTYTLTFVNNTNYVVTVTPAASSQNAISFTYSVSGVKTYRCELFSGSIVEGDYIIYSEHSSKGGAMNTTEDSSRLQITGVTPSTNIITTSDSAIIWHIAPSGDYWTIYNAAEGKYAAATGTNNQATLNADGTDNKSLWSITGSSDFTLENKHNKANSKNAKLSRNQDYGFGTYSSGTVKLYRSLEAKDFETTYVKKNIDYPASAPTGVEGTACLSTSKGGQGYYDDAIAAYAKLSAWGKKEFATFDSFANARARLIAWAAANGVTLSFNSDGSINTSGAVRLGTYVNSNNAGIIAIIAVATAISAIAVCGLLISKKRKED